MMIIEDDRRAALTATDAREYILDILQELAQLARSGNDRVSEQAVTACWRAIWRSDRS